jgi:peptide/nickel transport system permease protein
MEDGHETTGLRLPSHGVQAVSRWRSQPTLVAGTLLLAVMIAACLLAGVVSPSSPEQIDLTAVLQEPSWTHPLGTDAAGRDLFTRILYGGRNSLLIASIGAVGSMAVGVALGLLAAFGRRLSRWLVVRLIDVQLAFPYVLLAIAITSAVRTSIGVLVLLMVLGGWAQAARVVRSVALQEQAKDYVKAAYAIGASGRRVALKYVLPGVWPAILALAPLQAAAMLVFEATLSFLGMGIQPPEPSWGTIMLEGKNYLASAWWLTTFPGLAIFLTALALINIATAVRPSPHEGVSI